MIAYLLNLADLAFTMHALRYGGVELNPIANAMITAHPLLYPAYKVLAVWAMCYLLHYFRSDTKMAAWGLKICAAMFVAVDLWHIVNLFLIWRK